MNSRLSRPRTAVLLLALSFGVSGCGVWDTFGPSPNQEILSLARSAAVDAHSWDTLADVRAAQSAALFAEITRLCGTREGKVPNSCQVDSNTLDGAEGTPDAQAAAEKLIIGANTAPAESRPLLAKQAIELLSAPETAHNSAAQNYLTAVADSTVAATLSEADANLARELLAWEYQASYGVSACQAWLSTPQLSAELQAHELRIAALLAVLEPTGEVPVSEPAYRFADTTPVNAETAQSFLDQQASATTQEWAAVAGRTEEEAARRLAIWGAVL